MKVTKEKNTVDNSEQLKDLYLESEKHQIRDLDKIKAALSEIKDNSVIDKLLDAINYTNATYNVLKMQYLILYITLYLHEKKIIQNQTIPVNTSLKILLKQDWITDNTKDFLKKHFTKVLTENLDYSKYLINIDTYLEHSTVFN